MVTAAAEACRRNRRSGERATAPAQWASVCDGITIMRPRQRYTSLAMLPEGKAPIVARRSRQSGFFRAPGRRLKGADFCP